MRTVAWTWLLGLVCAAPVWAGEYGFHMAARLPEESSVLEVELTVAPGDARLSQVTFTIHDDWRGHYSGWEGDGEVEVETGAVTWSPPRAGGSLRYRVELNHARDGGRPDSWITDHWAIFRLDRIVPRTRTRTTRGAESFTTFTFDLPPGWALHTAHPPEDAAYRVDMGQDRFQRPRGWVIAGDQLASRGVTLGERRLEVVGPSSLRRQVERVAAFMEEHGPALLEVFDRAPPRSLLICAPEGMWRGGLSGPWSLFLNVHVGLVQRDQTSTVLHEMVHVFTRGRSSRDGDWFVEGIPEFYTLEIRRRVGTLSEEGYRNALDDMRERSRNVRTLRVSDSSGDTTRRAVVVLAALDQQIREATGGAKSLDDVARGLEGLDEVSTATFQALCEDVSGADLSAFFAEQVP